MSLHCWFKSLGRARPFTSRSRRRRSADLYSVSSAWQAEVLEDRVLLSVAQVFVKGMDDNIYAMKLDAAGQPTTSYFPTNAGQVKSFLVGHDAADNAIVFATGMDDQIYAQKFNSAGNVASSWFLVSPGNVKSVAVTNDAAGRPEVFVVGLDNQVYSQKFDAAGNPLGTYTLTTAGGVQSISAGHDAAGNPLLFAHGLDDRIYTQKFDANGNSISGYNLVTAGLTASTFAVGYTASNNPELFIIGKDGLIYAQKFDSLSNGSGSFFNVPMGSSFSQASAISVTRDPSNAPIVVVIGVNQGWNHEVSWLRLTASGDLSSNFAPQRLVLFEANDVGATQDAAGNPLIYATSVTNRLYLQDNLLDFFSGQRFKLLQGSVIKGFEIWAGR